MMFSDLLRSLEAASSLDLQQVVEESQRDKKVAPPMRPGDVIRASGINRFCPRFEAIRCERQLTIEDEIEPKLSRIFAFGRVFEKYLRDDVLGEKGVLIGKWSCNRCGHVREKGDDGYPRYSKPKHCINCDHNVFNYVEEFALDEGSNVGGSTDGFIKWNNDYHLLEVKTANDNNFKKVIKEQRPLEDHVAQAQIYMYLHNYKSVVFWYYNKNTSQQATFWMKYDPHHVRSLLDKGYAMKEYFRTKQLPKRICSDIRCPKASECGLAQICFKEYAD